MRALICELRPESLDHAGLTAAPEKQAAALPLRA
jgi:signal transduction histidine kinase